jgi:hypothetical protein
LKLVGAIPLLPEEHRQALYKKAAKGIQMELKDDLFFGRGDRMVRILADMPREYQVKFAFRVHMGCYGDKKAEKLMEELMPGVLKESEAGGFGWRYDD